MFNDFGIVYVTEGHKHAQEGWVNTACPFCTGNPGYHLGWNLTEEYWYCWRCGWKAPITAIKGVLNVGYEQARGYASVYGINRTLIKITKKERKPFKLPTGVERLNRKAADYLSLRGFDPQIIRKKWGVCSLGPLSKLGYSDYRFRILIPYMWNGQMVTFDTRDISGTASEKYKACPKQYERLERKHVLYGNQKRWGKVGICVEGPTDVWRLGDHAFAVSGIEYTQKQVQLIAQIFKRVFIVFDGEPQAQKKARELRSELRMRNVWAENLKLASHNDPGIMTQDEADRFVNNLLTTRGYG